jgi:hypothetical protein
MRDINVGNTPALLLITHRFSPDFMNAPETVGNTIRRAKLLPTFG